MGALASLGPFIASSSEVCGAQGSRGHWGAARGIGGDRGQRGLAGLPYRVQYHSFRQREHRLAASVPHAPQRGLLGARASIMSRL